MKHRLRLIFLLLAIIPGIDAYSQARQLMAGDSISLMKQAAIWEEEYFIRKQEAVRYAAERNIPVRRVLDDGTEQELQYIDEFGLPVYYQTRNAGAARTTSVSALYPGGALRLFLTGKGFYAGVWDGGRIDITHNELTGRVSMKDGSNSNSDHATHVTGTIMASGNQPSARGMAYEAEVHGYDWNNDLSEMATAAASGMLISNHSYGIVLGWSRNNGDWKWNAHADSTRDYRFGLYTQLSKSIDEIAFNAPYYTIVWAAGNDRSDTGDGTRPPDGPYDTTGPEAIAKNVIAVGAVRKISGGYKNPADVQISNFSSYGPADDGRIKPDIVAAGVDLYSTVHTNAYSSMSGTSMAAPNATGSLLLLQQLYASQNAGTPMKAATLKGLAIHTAHAAGISEGPDYIFGWGLLNTQGAARLINRRNEDDFIISESTLLQSESFELEFEADGSGSIVATISWTDPVGTPPTASMNPRNSMLVNDLDMRIFDQDGNAYQPWILNPELPAAAATMGDNSRDNVEKILIKTPAPGTYRLVIAHKGELKNGSQDYSLFLQTRDVPVRKTLFWIGKTGQWHTPGNWSLSSGGISVNDIPGPDDHVVFDGKSFSGSDSYTVELLGDAACYSFSWEAEEPVNVMFNSYTLEVATSLYATSENLTAGTDGTIVFTGTQKDNVVRFPDAFGEKLTLRFAGEAGSWKFISDFRVFAIEIVAGDMDMSSRNIQAASIKSLPGQYKRLNMSQSIITGLSMIDFDDEQLDLIAGGVSLSFTNDYSDEFQGYLIGGGRTFSRIINESHTLSIHGNNKIDTLYNHSILRLTGDQVFDKLVLYPGSVLGIQGGTTQEILSSLDAIGEPGNVILIAGIGEEPAWLISRNSLKICADYLLVFNVSIKGYAVFNAGLNSTIDESSIGWMELDCADILFADFDVEYNCVNSLVFFHDRSSGEITEYRWNFNIEDPEHPGSSLRNPYYIYSDTGYFNVSLRVGDGEFQHTGIKRVYMQPNPLSLPGIFVQGNRYTSTTSAAYYQWFLNGQPIPGANSRAYENVTHDPGEFQVMISNRTCNRISAPLSTTTPELELTDGTLVSIYPNPVRGTINIRGQFPEQSYVNLEIVDMQGKVMYNKILMGLELSNLQIDAGFLMPGMYIVRLGFKTEMVTTSIIVQ